MKHIFIILIFTFSSVIAKSEILKQVQDDTKLTIPIALNSNYLEQSYRHSGLAQGSNIQEKINKDAILLFHNTKCLVCQNQSIEDSNSLFANNLKQTIKEQLAQGKSIKEIEQFLVKTYGPEIIYTPPFNFETLLLWLGPFIVILMGIRVLFRKIK